MFFLSLAMSLSAPTALPQDATPPAQDPNKVICRNIRLTGSRVGGQRVCNTRAEWDRIAREARTLGQEVQDRPITPEKSN